MFRPRQALPLDRRTEARLLLHDHLIAAVARQPVELTRRYLDVWLESLADTITSEGTVVCDRVVIGRPTPELLEIAHELRLMRRAEARGEFDHEEDDWYELHGDDAEPWVDPTAPERVVAALTGRPRFGPLVTHATVDARVGRQMAVTLRELLNVIRISWCAERLLTEVSDVVRIDEFAVVDARLPGERWDGLDWAA